jgi:hypothetical protein
VGVEDSEDRKKLYFLIQRLQTVIFATSTQNVIGIPLTAFSPFRYRFSRAKVVVEITTTKTSLRHPPRFLRPHRKRTFGSFLLPLPLHSVSSLSAVDIHICHL